MPKATAVAKQAPPEQGGLFDGLIRAADELVGDVFDVAEEAVDLAGGGGEDGRSGERETEGVREGESVGSGEREAPVDSTLRGPIAINLNLGKFLRDAVNLAGGGKPKPGGKPAKSAPTEEDPEEPETPA